MNAAPNESEASAPASAGPMAGADRSLARLRRAFRVAIGVYLFNVVLALYPQTGDPAGDIKRLITAWFAAGIGVAWAVASWRLGLAWRRPRLFGGLWLAFFAWYAAAAVLSPYRGLPAAELTGFLCLAALYFVASQVYESAAQVQRTLTVLCVAVTLASCYGFLQKAGLDPFPWDDRTSDVYLGLPATFGNPNFAAHTLILTIVLSAALAATGQPWCFVLAVLQATHLYYTGQRGGLIALAGAGALVAIALLLRRRVQRPAAAAAASLALCGLIGLAGLLGAMGLTRLLTRTPIPIDTPLLIRYQSYVSASDMFYEKPLFGWGPGAYARAYPAFWTPFEKEWFAQELRKNDHVHNDLIELAVDAGLPAAGLYLSLLVLAMTFALALGLAHGPPARRRLGLAFAAVFAAFLIDGFFGFNLRVPVSAAILFVALGMLDGLYAGPGQPLRGGARAHAARMALALALLASALLQSRIFAAEYELLQGRVAEHRAAADPDPAPRLAAARAHLARGERLAWWKDDFAWRMGRLALGEGKVEEAIGHFERALRVNPDGILTRLPLAQARLQRAQRFLQEHRDRPDEAMAMLDEAAADARRLLERAPAFPRAEAMLGQIAAVGAIFLSATAPETHAERIAALWDEAQQQLESALRHGIAGEASFYRMLAKVRLAQGDPLMAEAALVRSAAADPADVETWPLFVDFANGQQRYDRLRNTLYAQIRTLGDRDDDAGRHALATCQLTLANVLENGYGDLAGADAAYAKAIALAPRRAEVWTNFARYAAEHGRRDALRGAIAQSTATLQLAGETPLPHVAALNTAMQLGLPAMDAASGALANAVRAHPAMAAMGTADTYGWAVRMMAEVLPATPPPDGVPCDAYLHLGIACAGMDDLGLAQRLFAEADACLPAARKGALAIYWADALVRAGQTEAALDRLRQAQPLDPANLDLRWAIARTLVKLGRNPEAREAYGALLAETGLAPQAKAMLEAERNVLPQ